MQRFSGKIAIGQSSFEQIRERGCYFVDKSRFIREILEAADVTLLTRPRRFGKTLTLSMLRSFLSLDYQNPEDRSKAQRLFEGLDVLRDEAFCRECLGRWPVVHLSLKDVEGETFEEALAMFRRVILEAAKPFAFLADSQRITSLDRMAFARLLSTAQAPLLNVKDVLTESLYTMEAVLYAHFGRRAVVLIDEYDVPLQKARIMGYYEPMIQVLRRFFSFGLKDSPYLGKAVLTGCLRLAKESVFTGMNNFKSCGIAQVQLRDAVGFSESEAQRVLRDFGLQDHAGLVKKHYDGYRFGGMEIYCPWDLLNYCADTLAGERGPENYWINTSSNDLISEFINYADERHLELLRRLMKGEEVCARIDDGLSFADLNKAHSPDQLMSLLYSTGYITKTAELADRQSLLRIPNEEVRECFRDRIAAYFTPDNDGYVGASRRLFDAFVDGRSLEVQAILNDYLMRFASVRDTGPEAFYHGLLLGMLGTATNLKEGKDLLSNREAGGGFFDIALMDSRRNIGVVLELKKAKSDEPEPLARSCREALGQIASRGYETGFGGLREMRCYGIAFCGKRCLVQAAPPQKGSAA